MTIVSIHIHMICLNGTCNLSTCIKVNSNTFDLGLESICGSKLEGVNLTDNIDEILRLFNRVQLLLLNFNRMTP